MLASTSSFIGQHVVAIDADLALEYDFRQSVLGSVAIVGPDPTWSDRGSDALMFDSTGVLVTRATGEPRFAAHTYDGSNWINRGYLVEEQRTNLCLQSEDLGTTWTNPGANTTITANAGDTPDGNTTADDILHDDNAETIQQTITAADNTVHTISAFVKQGTTGSHDWVKIAWLDQSAGANGFEAWFDISAGTVGTAQADGTGAYTANSATIEDIADGWYRISAAGQIPSGQTDARFEIINTTADGVDTAEATNSVWWWGLQVEAGAFPTSYIPTTTSQVTRSKDVLTTTDMSWYNETEGTFLAKSMVPFLPNSNSGAWAVDDGTSADRWYIYSPDTGNDTNSFTINSTGSTDDFALVYTSADWVGGTSKTYAVALKEDDGAISVDGASVLTDNTGDLPTGLTRMLIGTHVFDVSYNGFIEYIKYWNVRNPDAELEAITS